MRRGRAARARDGRPPWPTAASRPTWSTRALGAVDGDRPRHRRRRSRTPGVEMGVHLHFNTTLEAILGDADGAVRGVATSDGEIACRPVRRRTHKVPNNDPGRRGRPQVGSTGGFIVDERWRPPCPDVWAAGDCIEVPHGVSQRPAAGPDRAATPTPRARSPGSTQPAAGAATSRSTSPGAWRPASGSSAGSRSARRSATALGIPYVMGTAQGSPAPATTRTSSRSRVKLLAEPGTLRLIGAQMVGGEGIKERADFLAMAVTHRHHPARPRDDGERLLARRSER